MPPPVVAVLDYFRPPPPKDFRTPTSHESISSGPLPPHRASYSVHEHMISFEIGLFTLSMFPVSALRHSRQAFPKYGARLRIFLKGPPDRPLLSEFPLLDILTVFFHLVSSERVPAELHVSLVIPHVFPLSSDSPLRVL